MIAILLLLYLVLAAATAVALRKRSAFFQRLNDLNWQALLLIDIAAAFLLFWPLYLIGVLEPRPGPWVTISTHCWASALDGRRWAVKAVTAIDALFFVLTSQKDHCAKSYAAWCAPLGTAG